MKQQSTANIDEENTEENKLPEKLSVSIQNEGREYDANVVELSASSEEEYISRRRKNH